MHACTIVGYSFQADIYCARHITEALPTGEGEPFDGWNLAPGVEMSTEANLDEIAAAFGIDRMREETFDSGDFPKIIFATQALDSDACSTCQEPLL